MIKAKHRPAGRRRTRGPMVRCSKPVCIENACVVQGTHLSVKRGASVNAPTWLPPALDESKYVFPLQQKFVWPTVSVSRAAARFLSVDFRQEFCQT